MSFWPPPSRILAALEGPWRFRRWIADQAILLGRARFAPVGKGLARYVEDADLDRPAAFRGDVFEQTRRGFRVHLDEKPRRVFHEVELSGRQHAVAGRGVHLYGLDTCVSDYVFHEDASFTLTQQVIGSRRLSPVVTEYRRHFDG